MSYQLRNSVIAFRSLITAATLISTMGGLMAGLRKLREDEFNEFLAIGLGMFVVECFYVSILFVYSGTQYRVRFYPPFGVEYFI